MSTATLDRVVTDEVTAEDSALVCEVLTRDSPAEEWSECAEPATHRVVFDYHGEIRSKLSCDGCLLDIWEGGQLISATKLGGKD